MTFCKGASPFILEIELIVCSIDTSLFLQSRQLCFRKARSSYLRFKTEYGKAREPLCGAFKDLFISVLLLILLQFVELNL